MGRFALLFLLIILLTSGELRDVGRRRTRRNQPPWVYAPCNIVSSNFPAVDLASKNYSLEADMVTGWRPKIKLVGPIPFNFDSRVVDELIDELTSFGSRHKERVIYLGNCWITKATGTPVALSFINRWATSTVSSMRPSFLAISLTWQPTSENSMRISNPKTVFVFLREWTPQSKLATSCSLTAIFKAET